MLVSAIEHYVYCPRQFALIHVEQVFESNADTLLGDRLHERVDVAHVVRREGVRTEFAVPLWSDVYGLSGRADALEFSGEGGVWPIEYKKGDRRPKRHDDLQLCAQALCLEEMLGICVPRGSVYYHKSRRWREVELDQRLREETVAVIGCIRDITRSGAMPPPVHDKRCDRCSLIEACQPELLVTARLHDQESWPFVQGGEGH